MNNKDQFNFHFPRWEEFPNIDLYLDQTVTILEIYLEPFIANKEEKIITKTMINNYIKQNIIPAPINKKYTKAHIATLFVICILKQVYSINNIAELINLSFKSDNVMTAYNNFCTALEKAIQTTFQENSYETEPNLKQEKYILKNVVQSFASKLYVEKVFLSKTK